MKWINPILRPFTIFKGEPFGEGCVKLGIGVLAIPEGKGNSWLYFDEKSVVRFGKNIVSKIKKERNFVKNHVKDCYKTCESFVKLCKGIGRKNLRKKSNKELYKLFLQYYKNYVNYTFFIMVPLSIEKFVLKFVEENIEKILKEKNKSNLLKNYIETFTKETKPIEVKKEEISLLKIKVEIEKNKDKITPAIDKKIDEHIKKYCWIPVYEVTHKPWAKEYFLKRLEKISNPKEKLEKINKEFRNRREKSKVAIKELNPDKKLLNMIEILQEYMFLRTYRTDSLRKVMYYIQPLVEEVARRTELTKEEVAYMTKEEIKEFLLENKTPDKKLIRERIKHCLLLRTKNLNLIVSDKKGIGKIINKELGKKRTEVKKVKGSIACRGIAMGKVRIIKSPKDLEKLKKGDILVTSMTSPDMTIAIRKAGAIVTDEGGITCHAAIVSREMNTPCVIGTEKATKVFKNGDLIVVDAENGIVEKVKK